MVLRIRDPILIGPLWWKISVWKINLNFIIQISELKKKNFWDKMIKMIMMMLSHSARSLTPPSACTQGAARVSTTFRGGNDRDLNKKIWKISCKKKHSCKERVTVQNGWIFGKVPMGGGSFSIQKIILQMLDLCIQGYKQDLSGKKLQYDFPKIQPFCYRHPSLREQLLISTKTFVCCQMPTWTSSSLCELPCSVRPKPALHQILFTSWSFFSLMVIVYQYWQETQAISKYCD